MVDQLSMDNKKMRLEIEGHRQDMGEVQSMLNEFRNQVELEKSRAESSSQREKEMIMRVEHSQNEVDKL